MSEWKPIETAPEIPFVNFLVVEQSDIYFAFRDDELQWWISTEARQSCAPTHWIQLPALPEAGELPKGWRKLGHDESGKLVGVEAYCQECALSPRFGICCICGRPAPPQPDAL